MRHICEKPGILVLLLVLTQLGSITIYASETQIDILRKKPCNIFFSGEKIKFKAKIKNPSDNSIFLKVTDYKKNPVIEREIKLKSGQKNIDIPLGNLPCGYYELRLATKTPEGIKSCLKDIDKNGFVSFGVAEKIDRTAKEVRDGDYRIGLKMWYLDKAWWRGNADFIESEAVQATTGLGLQWTRAEMARKTHYPTPDLIRRNPMNVILKVESFPKELFDTKRYGPLDEWIKKNGRAWMKKTVPQKKGYKKYLREVLKTIPKDQKVFEIWNEAWDKMSAEDLATISNWAAEVILEDRPNAIIGPNLLGTTSQYDYDAKFINAGGMKHMKMVALHPYTSKPLKPLLQEYRKWLKEKTGRDIDIYVTEYGTHSCPEGPAKQSEEQQAEKVAWQTVELYAGDVKAMTPHWLGQREENRTYHEHWFGYYRLNHEPKPALLALATCARMIDGKKYIGDLWYGPGIGASIFEKDNKYTLALWTKNNNKKEVTIDTGANEITLTDIVGGSKKVKTDNGKIKLAVTDEIIYIEGVNPELANTASKEIRADRWPQPKKKPRLTRIAPKASAEMKMDGKLEDWKGALQISMVNQKVNGDDASGIAYISWDDNFLYIGLNMRDNQVMNTQPLPKLYRNDSIELFVSTEPRDTDKGYGPNDYQFFITPTSQSGKPVVAVLLDREAGILGELKKAKYNIGKINKGWRAEVAIPWKTFKNFKPASGKKIALEMRVNDADNSHERWKIDPHGVTVLPHDPTKWSILELK